MISGSIGYDDWEWGVDLFADDPLVFKKLIYEMRFDEASAKFAEFGPFYTGLQFAPGAAGGVSERRVPALVRERRCVNGARSSRSCNRRTVLDTSPVTVLVRRVSRCALNT